MDILEGPIAVLGVVLVVSGVLKLVDTAPTEAMLGAVGLPRSRAAVVVVALAEVVVGVSAFVFGGRLASAALAALYGGFAVISLVLVRRGERNVSCGCFGRSSATISPVHVAVDAVAALIGLAAAITSVPGFFDLQPDLPAFGLVQLAFVALAAWLTIAVLTVLPETLDAARRTPASDPSAVRTFGLVSETAP